MFAPLSLLRENYELCPRAITAWSVFLFAEGKWNVVLADAERLVISRLVSLLPSLRSLLPVRHYLAHVTPEPSFFRYSHQCIHE
jgi:hypothetical protein